MSDCEKFEGKGRLEDLCLGVGLDGRDNPTQEACDRFRTWAGLQKILVANPGLKQPKIKPVSQIGTRLANIFRDTWGAIPCGNCKQAIAELNGFTVDQVKLNREQWVNVITQNALSAAPKYWQKITISADQFLHAGGTEFVIGMHLDKACDLEIKEAGYGAEQRD